jgi:hypothetical protein
MVWKPNILALGGWVCVAANGSGCGTASCYPWDNKYRDFGRPSSLGFHRAENRTSLAIPKVAVVI